MNKTIRTLIRGTGVLMATQILAAPLEYTSTSEESLIVQYSSDGTQIQIVKDAAIVASQASATTESIIYTGSTGNDWISNETDIPLIAEGGDGNDVLIGGSANDDLSGNGGSDLIVGRDGSDSMYGGSQTDILIGGSGADYFNANAGTDLLIEGSTIYDDRPADLSILLALWLDSAITIDHLLNGVIGIHLNYESGVVQNDSAIDSLNGANGSDVIMAGYNDTIVDIDSDIIHPWFLPYTGGSSSIPSGWLNLYEIIGANAEAATITEFVDDTLPTGNALRVENELTSSPAPNDTRVTLTTENSVSAGDILCLSFFYRATTTSTNDDPYIRLNWNTDSSSSIKIPEETLFLDAESEWKQYVGHFAAPVDTEDSTPYTSTITFSLGTVEQIVDFSDIELISYDPSTHSLDAMRHPVTYRYAGEVLQSQTIIPVTGNDVDTVGDLLRPTAILTEPEHGMAWINEYDQLVYQKEPGYFGKVEFKYTMTDADGHTGNNDVKLLCKHDYTDGTWHFGTHTDFYTTTNRKQYIPLSDDYNTPFGSWAMRRATANDNDNDADGDGIPDRNAAYVYSDNNPLTDPYWSVFGKIQPDGSIGYPAGWTWHIPKTWAGVTNLNATRNPDEQLAESLPTGNWGYAGIQLHSGDNNWHGVSGDEIESWVFDIDVETAMLGYNRQLLINSYWWSTPAGDVGDTNISYKTLDLGIFFETEEMMDKKPDWIDLTAEFGRTVYLDLDVRDDGAGLNIDLGKRFYVVIEDFDKFDVTTFDMGQYIDYLYDNNLWTLPIYFEGGAFDMELKHRTADDPEDATSGEVYVKDFSYMIEIDAPAENSIGDRTLEISSPTLSIDLSDVFVRRGSDRKIYDELTSTWIDVTAEKTYTVQVNSNPSLLNTSVDGDTLELLPTAAGTGTATVTIRCTDWFNRWYDEETFTVTVRGDLEEIQDTATAVQSSTFGTDRFPADLALDGDTSTFSHTQNLDGSYWEMDLDGNYEVDEVKVVNRAHDNSAARLDNCRVWLYDSNDNIIWTSSPISGASNGSIHIITLPDNTVGDRIRVGLPSGQLNGKGDNVVCLAEVEASGYKR